MKSAVSPSTISHTTLLQGRLDRAASLKDCHEIAEQSNRKSLFFDGRDLLLTVSPRCHARTRHTR